MAVTHTHRSQAGAVAARTLLALFVVFGLVVLFLPTAPLGQPAGAQTASPAPTGPNIEFLNPSGATANSATSGPGREASSLQDDGNGYHLVAWVANIPANATVEFKYQSTASGSSEVPIGQGTLRGTDTFDIHWNIPQQLDDGNFTVKAILFSNTVEVDRDTEAVVVNDEDASTTPIGDIPEGENRGQTVEITYPLIAGPWGAFRKPGTNDRYAGVVDVTSSTNTTEVRAYYTTSVPGTEPIWTRCSTDNGETRANSLDGVRCTLAAGVSPTSVTAIAAASGDANQEPPDGCAPVPPDLPDCGEGEDSGDAHRAMGYVQTPTSISVSPSTQRKNDAVPADAGNQFDCSDVITATLVDQSSRKVAGANVDIKAAGPTDELYFDDPDDTAYQAPNSNNHATESTVDCETTTANPRSFNTAANQAQGEHEVSGEGDIKHVETTARGTSDAGQVKFRLYNRSTTLTGITQFTAWFDRDDDDRLCSAEPQGDGSIGWGVDAGSPFGVADEVGTCVEPSPTPTGSSSASPSPSASTASPSASPSRSSTASPSPTPQTSRTVGLSASKAKVVHGATITLNGQIISADESCEDAEFVRIRRRVHGTDTFVDFLTLTSDSEGLFSASFEVNASADYQAVATAHDSCAEGSSQAVTVLVKVKVSINVSDFRPERGTNVKITGKVTPNHSGSKVVLQRKKAGRWVKVKSDTLSGRSRYSFTIPAGWRQDRLFRVKWNSTDADHETGRSQKVKITTHN